MADGTVLTLGNWRAVKRNDHCWQLQKRAGEESKREWESVEFYPTTIEGAAKALWERAARDMGGEYGLADPDAIAERLARLFGELRQSMAEMCGLAADAIGGR